MSRQCTICGFSHEDEQIMLLNDLRRMLLASKDRCPTAWGALNVAQVLVTEIDRINTELVKLRAQVPQRIKFEIIDQDPITVGGQQRSTVLMSVDPKVTGEQ